MALVGIDTHTARNAAARLRGVVTMTRPADAASLVPPGSVAPARSLTRLLQAERHHSELVGERITAAAHRLEHVVSAVLAADRYDGAAR